MPLYSSVLDDFKLLPQTVVEPFPGLNVKEWMLDQRRGSVIDIENGYIFAQGDGGIPSLHVAKWKSINVTIVTTELNDIYGPRFYACKNIDGKLIEIKLDWYRPGHQYLLPHYGKDIIEYDEKLNIISVIKFINNQFVVRRVD